MSAFITIIVGLIAVGILVYMLIKKNDIKMTLLLLGIILMYISMGQMFNLPIPNILNMVQNPKIYAISLMILSLLFIFL